MTQLHTSRWVYGFDHNVLFNSGRVVCGMHKHNNPAETAVVVYGLDQQWGKGGVEKLKTRLVRQQPSGTTRDWGRPVLAFPLRSGMVLRACACLPVYPHEE